MGDKSRTRTNTRIELGLSIVKKIVDIHEETITVVSSVGKGMEFIIRLRGEGDN